MDERAVAGYRADAAYIMARLLNAIALGGALRKQSLQNYLRYDFRFRCWGSEAIDLVGRAAAI